MIADARPDGPEGGQAPMTCGSRSLLGWSAGRIACFYDHRAGSCPGTPARDLFSRVRAPRRSFGAGRAAQADRLRRAVPAAREPVLRPELAAGIPGQRGPGVAGAVPAAVPAAA